MKRFDASLEWLMERIGMRDVRIEKIRQNGEIEENEESDAPSKKNQQYHGSP